MAINYEIKSQLAKLLATEDIVVENRDVMTAQFDVDSRVLTLPKWKRASNSVYDMLVGHEVGHALYTPNVDPPKDIPHSFVNIVEDARIEKKMKQRYPGLSKSFYKGYKELSDDDFFCIGDQDLKKMNLADRINLYYKIGNFVDLPFTEEEMNLVHKVNQTDTFEDVCELARDIYKYCKSETPSTDQHQQPQTETPNGQPGDSVESPEGSSGSGEDDEMTHEEMIEEAEKRESENQEDVDDQLEQEGGEPEATTDKAFEDGISELSGMDNGIDNVYVEVPKVNLDKIIITNKRVHEEIDLSWQQQSIPLNHTCEWTGKVTEHKADFSVADEAYQKFKKSAQREVNYLVKEFECKKSADAYARATVSKTGVLDCTKLHTYKYNEDLFRKVSVLPDGQNHGLIFILDWSGSMGTCILDTIKQLFNLVWFCNKCNIPFDVYAFTNSYLWNSEDEAVENESMDWEINKLFVHKDFNLLNLLTGNVKRKELEKQMLNVWRMVYNMRHWTEYEIPSGYGLSGTPLNETLVSLHQIIPQFQKNHDLQKVQCVILTDGEANHLPYCKPWHSERYGEKEGTSNLVRGHSYLRNRKTGHTYKVGDYFYQFTELLLSDLKESFPYTNFIGIRLAGARDINSMVRRYTGEDSSKSVKKDKFFSLKTSGYDSYFLMVDQSLSNEVEFDVEEGATKAKIKSAFAKNLKSKALNKKVLSQFMDLVC
jgi:hypothetical protein